MRIQSLGRSDRFNRRRVSIGILFLVTLFFVIGALSQLMGAQTERNSLVHASEGLVEFEDISAPPAFPPRVPPRIFFVITTSIKVSEGERDASARQEQYERGIRSLLNVTKSGRVLLEGKVVIVENNGRRSTYLDNYKEDGVNEVLYTDHNSLLVEKGVKEWLDVLATIRHMKMQSTDLVVKLTGRYYFDSNEAPFLKAIYDLDWTKTQAVVKFGSYGHTSEHQMADCVTGLILAPVHSIQSMAIDKEHRHKDPIEWAWARSILRLPTESIKAFPGKLGLWIAPGGGDYWMI